MKTNISKTGANFVVKGVLICVFILLIIPQTKAQNKQDLFDLSIEELLRIDNEQSGIKFYGFFNTNFEKVFGVPYINGNGVTVKENSSAEWSLPGFHLYGSSKLNDKIDVLFNIAFDGDKLDLRNAYANFKINNLFQFRIGKMYKRFGLFNEKLDQTPTFLGIEPPELLDNDHLLLSRLTTLMLHGEREHEKFTVSYAVSTGNGEGANNFDVIPISWDLRIKSSSMIIGTSGYRSSIGKEEATSTVGLGDGSPLGGVLPWMSEDRYSVFGGYLEKRFGNLLIKTAFWNASHKAQRDASSVLSLFDNAGINDAQRSNFLGDSANKADSMLTTSDIVINANYNVQTFYIRFGYNIETDFGKFIPYLFFDWMSHPEVIAKKAWGGDNEAGFADNGIFMKPSIGILYKPIDKVAIKLDASIHNQQFNGVMETYPEIRFDISYAFK